MFFLYPRRSGLVEESNHLRMVSFKKGSPLPACPPRGKRGESRKKEFGRTRARTFSKVSGTTHDSRPLDLISIKVSSHCHCSCWIEPLSKLDWWIADFGEACLVGARTCRKREDAETGKDSRNVFYFRNLKHVM